MFDIEVLNALFGLCVTTVRGRGGGGVGFFFFKQKTSYEIGTGDWSSDLCSSDLSHWKIGLMMCVSWVVIRPAARPFLINSKRPACASRLKNAWSMKRLPHSRGVA